MAFVGAGVRIEDDDAAVAVTVGDEELVRLRQTHMSAARFTFTLSFDPWLCLSEGEGSLGLSGHGRHKGHSVNLDPL